MTKLDESQDSYKVLESKISLKLDEATTPLIKSLNEIKIQNEDLRKQLEVKNIEIKEVADENLEKFTHDADIISKLEVKVSNLESSISNDSNSNSNEMKELVSVIHIFSL